jgi:PAS domain S-box-containing protein
MPHSQPPTNRRFELSPGTIALLYTGFSALWIAFSDVLVNRVQDPGTRLFLATSKGLLFVAITATMLYFLVTKLVARERQTKQSLAISEQEYLGVVHGTNEGVCRLNDQDRIRYVNPRMERWLQLGAEEIIGRKLSDFLSEDQVESFARQLERWRSGEGDQQDFCFRGADGDEIRAIVSGTPVFDARGAYSGCFLMLMDVTERQRIQEQLRVASPTTSTMCLGS